MDKSACSRSLTSLLSPVDMAREGNDFIPLVCRSVVSNGSSPSQSPSQSCCGKFSQQFRPFAVELGEIASLQQSGSHRTRGSGEREATTPSEHFQRRTNEGSDSFSLPASFSSLSSFSPPARCIGIPNTSNEIHVEMATDCSFVSSANKSSKHCPWGSLLLPSICVPTWLGHRD